tara:strand:+ start:3024 stop:3281 length:258 start_codon:yes stop_codon:yes gene_type:complete
MNKTEWIVRQIMKDSRKNYKWVLKGVGLTLAVIFIIKVLLFFNIDRQIIFPILWIVFVLGMIYHWYSMGYDNEQKKIIDKLKGEE